MSTRGGVVLSDVHIDVGGDVEVKLTKGHDLELGLSWDFFEGMSPVDLDCSVLVFDFAGMLVDACFYNNLRACDGCIQHSGDELSGEKDGYDETVKIELDGLDPAVTMMAFLVNAHEGGSFQNVESAYAVLSDLQGAGQPPKLLADVAIGCGTSSTAAVIGVLYRDGMTATSPWKFRNVGKMCGGKNFQESMPHIREVIDTFVDPGLLLERTASMTGKAFKMSKGDSLEIPAGLFRHGDDFFIGLGWTCRGDLDLDASVLIVDDKDRLIRTVNFANKTFGSCVVHQGDNQTGDGDGDDERIDMDLDPLPAYVSKLHIVVNVYDSGYGFDSVSDAYIRLAAIKNGHEFARYKLDATVKTNGLIFATLFRSPMGTWMLQA
ncbi:hypothetical protein TrRE_jg9905, partial [Triparma retinervis]